MGDVGVYRKGLFYTRRRFVPHPPAPCRTRILVSATAAGGPVMLPQPRVRHMRSLLLAALPLLSRALVAHVIPHSHCDPGWLETFEGYFQTQVNSILNSVVDTVSADPARRFVWAESSFLMRWYEVATEARRAQLRSLVASGQVEFVGGGWVQNDEANPDYGAVISQLTEGHEYLAQLFGSRPRYFWQLDPFGHAAATPALASAAGFEGLVVNRIDHSVKDALKARGALEFWWAPYGGNASILTHVLHSHYSAPKGFDFENPEGYPVGDGGAAGARAASLVAEIRARARAYRTPHILVPFGDDFKFQFAGRQFENMDKLIAAINAPGAFPGFSIRYSTLSEYFDAVAGALRGAPGEPSPPLPLPVYGPRDAGAGGADFFPYADNVHSYWAGYFCVAPRPQSRHPHHHRAAAGRGRAAGAGAPGRGRRRRLQLAARVPAPGAGAAGRGAVPPPRRHHGHVPRARGGGLREAHGGGRRRRASADRGRGRAAAGA